MKEVTLEDEIKHLENLLKMKYFRLELVNCTHDEVQEYENLEQLILRLKHLKSIKLEGK